MAPEQHVGGTNDASLDLWSFGIVLAALVTGRHPLREVPHEKWHSEMLLDRLPDGASEEAASSWTKHPEARDLARNVLRLQPVDRLTAARALDHEWIAKHAGNKNGGQQEERGGWHDLSFDEPTQQEDQARRRRRRRRWVFPCGGGGNAVVSEPTTTDQPDQPDQEQDPPPGTLVADLDDDDEQDWSTLPRFLAGLREVRRTKLQKALLLAVALRGTADDDADVRTAIGLFESTKKKDAAHLTRDDVEDALLSDANVGMRAADELCDVFDDIGPTVSQTDFVAAILALRRDNDHRLDLLRPILKELEDPDDAGTVKGRTLADFLRSSLVKSESTTDRPAGFPDEDDVDSLFQAAAVLPDSSLSYDAVVDLLYSQQAV
mmetsp:Transcript_15430/g.50470  ORF Transcript_15430/g.50470 Transcript_15430/m.50470 type:complete len:377 (+) Transcript_15430:675-1805(+)